MSERETLAEYPGRDPARCLFTVFIPTYNRAHLLPRALASIERQRLRDFEVLIVDDGSADGTRELVTDWAARVPFPVHYHWQPNQGKPAAYNAAIGLIEGYFCVLLDSDDVLADDALEALDRRWREIPLEARPATAGVEGLCAYLADGRVLGNRFPEEAMDSDYLEIRYRFGVIGEKKHAIRTRVMAQFPFPLFPGERHMRESVVLSRMAHRYRFRYVNDIVQYVEYQPDGLSADPFVRRMDSPRGFSLAFREHVNDHCADCSFAQLFGYMSKFIRYSLHAGQGLAAQWRAIDRHGLFLLALPRGLLDWARDRMRLRLRQPRSR